jgi:hypothetical protein
MATIDELRNMARNFYARARASHNPFTKRKLIKLADDYLQEAEVMRHNQSVASTDRRRIGTASHIKPKQLTSAGSRKLSWVR